jgi:hypothetical protein
LEAVVDYLNPKNSPLAGLMQLWANKEPDFVIGQFKFHISPIVPDDSLCVMFGNNVVVSQNGKWRELTREELDQKLREVLKL